MSRPSLSSKSKPFTIRLSAEERALLTRRAGSLTLAAYMRSVLFADGVKAKARGSRRVVKDHEALAAVLAQLGSSGLADNIRFLCDAAAMGVLHLDEDAPATLLQACEDIAVMRLALLKALGFPILDEGSSALSDFASASSRTRGAS